MLVTALNPKIGYEKSSKIAKKAFAEGITLKQAALKLKYLKSSEFDEIVDPSKMTKSSQFKNKSKILSGFNSSTFLSIKSFKDFGLIIIFFLFFRIEFIPPDKTADLIFSKS